MSICFLIFSGASSERIKIYLDCGTAISEDGRQQALALEVDVDNITHSDKFVALFIAKVLQQREKINLNLLDDILKPETKKSWLEVLESIEMRDRRLVDVSSGSVVLQIFCPTPESKLQLADAEWVANLEDAVTNLLHSIGKLINIWWQIILEPDRLYLAITWML